MRVRLGVKLRSGYMTLHDPMLIDASSINASETILTMAIDSICFMRITSQTNSGHLNFVFHFINRPMFHKQGCMYPILRAVFINI